MKKRVSVLIADYQYFGDKEQFSHELAEFNKAGIDVYFGNCITEEDLIEQGQQMDAILLCNNPPMGKNAFENLPDCKVVLRYGVGYNSIDIEEAAKTNTMILYMPGYCAEELATHASSLILALNRKIVFYDRNIRNGKWDVFDGYRLRRLSGQTLGLFGLGASGKILAHAFKFGWGMRVIAYDPYAATAEAIQQNAELVTFDELVRQSDIVSIHAPLNDETYHRFSEAEFKQMKTNAVIINVSRGAIIDQQALVHALQSGEIQAAGLDVFEQEPLEQNDCLFSLDNVVVTPHSAYYTEESANEQHRIAAKTVVEALSGKIPYNVVKHKS